MHKWAALILRLYQTLMSNVMMRQFLRPHLKSEHISLTPWLKGWIMNRRQLSDTVLQNFTNCNGKIHKSVGGILVSISSITTVNHYLSNVYVYVYAGTSRLCLKAEIFQGMSLLFLVLHLLGGVCGGGPVDDPSGSVGQVYQRVHTISPSLLNVQSFSISGETKDLSKSFSISLFVANCCQ